jgi:hypothetical protein
LKETISIRRSSVNIHLGCFGNFKLQDPICSKHCALRIRCAIERDQNVFMEYVEGMEAGTDFYLKFQ